MHRTSSSLALTLFICAISFQSSMAGPLEDGGAAFAREDFDSADRLLRPLAESGNTTAQAHVGAMELMGGSGSVDEAREAVAWLTKSAEGGNAVAQIMLGRSYLDLNRAAPDPVMAARWFRKAAEQDEAEGSAEAQLQLGRMYLTGLGVPQSGAEATKWLRKAAAGFKSAAARGDLRDQVSLAGMYEHGEGVVQDKERAGALYRSSADAYRRAADQGDARAQYQLGQMYWSGRGLRQSRVQAAVWLRRSADQGDRRAQAELGVFYTQSNSAWHLGQHDPEDTLQSYVWVALAAKGAPGSIANATSGLRESIAKELTAAQLAEADRGIRDWRPVKEEPRPDGGPIPMTPTQIAEAERLRRRWEPTPDEIDVAKRSAESYDVMIGSADAKIRIVEYVSPTSQLSARLNDEVLPALKAKYIDRGRVQLVIRDLVTVPSELATDTLLLAHCNGGRKYLEVLGSVFRTLDQIERGDPRTGLRDATRPLGISDQQFDKCLSDHAERDRLFQRMQVFVTLDGIQATPTFVVGDQTWMGVPSLARLELAMARVSGAPIEPIGGWSKGTSPIRKGFHILMVDRDARDDPAEKPPKPGDVRAPQTEDGDLWLRPEIIASGEMIASASIESGEDSRPVIDFRMNEGGRRRFAAATGSSVGKRFAIVWNGVVITAPYITEQITGGNGRITGRFNLQTARELVRSVAAPNQTRDHSK